MRAWRLERSGLGVAGLHMVEEPTPQPGPGEVLVKVHASSLSFRERMVLRGDYVLPVEPGIVPVSDGAGEVVALGEAVTRFALGDRVAANIFPDWHEGPLQLDAITQLGSSSDGMLTDYAALREGALVHIPGHLSYAEAATLPCAAVTAWNAVTGGQPVGAGDTVLTLGTGGVSLFAIQFAQHLGARVIATTGDEHKEARLRRLGAHAVVNYRSGRWDDTVRTLTGGLGVDRVVDVVGQVDHSLSMLRLGGEVAFVGFLAGAEAAPISLEALFYSAGNVRAISAGNRSQFEAMNKAITDGQLRPLIARTFAFDEAPQAYDFYADANPFGKVVITHGSSA